MPLFGFATRAEPETPAGLVGAHVWPFRSTFASKLSASMETMPSGPASWRKPTPVTLTFVNVAVQRAASLWLVTASPTKALVPIAIVSDPTVVQVDPLLETDAVKVDPVRTSRTQ